MAMKLALGRLKDLKSKTRDLAIDDVGCFESVELSLVFCNDEFIRQLNKEWRDEDHATDVLSMSQHVPELKIPIVRPHSLCVESPSRQKLEMLFIAAHVRRHCNFCRDSCEASRGKGALSC